MGETQQIKSFVLHHYGNLISAEEPEFDEKNRKWTAQIKSDYPLLLQDDRTEKQIVKFIHINHIGVISFNENIKFIEKESTARDKCVKTIQTLLGLWRDRTEKIVIQASANRFVDIPDFRHFFTPIEEIINYLLEKEVLCLDDLNIYRSKQKIEKMYQYLNLLEGLDLVSKTDEGFESGKALLFLREENEERYNKFKEEEFRKAVLSEIIRKRYSTLRDYFVISRLQPTIDIDSCIYRSSLEAEELMSLSQDSIVRDYNYYYGRVNPVVLNHHLRKLKTVGAIERRGGCWSGTKELLGNMLEIKKEMPELAPPM